MFIASRLEGLKKEYLIEEITSQSAASYKSSLCKECESEGADTHMLSRQSGGCLRRFPCLK